MRFYADLHVHIGSAQGEPVKITASRNLTLAKVFDACINKKGIDIVGIVDCACPPVLQELRELMDLGDLFELKGGGLSYKGRLTVFLGAEIETFEGSGVAHNIAFFPYLKQIEDFSERMSEYITNINLSSQRARISAQELLKIVKEYEGELIPAHVFTPFKSFYGRCYDRIFQAFTEDFNEILSVELGLSSDTLLADRISELSSKTFLSNSDAHSIEKIAREYNEIELTNPDFNSFVLALRGLDGNCVVANYGLDPRLGKYHRTLCLNCGYTAKEAPPVLECPHCRRNNITFGVLDRISQIADLPGPFHPLHRPPYYHHIPLEFVPGIGKKTMERLIIHFGNEMTVVHQANFEDLKEVVNEKIARNIILSRKGLLKLQAGGGGTYGKVIPKE